VNSFSVLARFGLGVVFSVAALPVLFAADEAHPHPAPAAAPTADHPAGDAGHDAAHHEHLGEAGVNKQPEEFRTDLAIFSAIVFGLLASGLYFTAWPKILGALAAREEGIRKAIADAEDAKVQATAFMKEHKGRLEAVENTVKEILAEARRDAEHTKLDITKQAEVEAEAIKNRAIAEINRAKDQALDELFSTLAHQVSKATEQVVGRALTGADQERLIQEAVQQFARQKA
jgi:F-type H+-transporting ATPase subunit b